MPSVPAAFCPDFGDDAEVRERMPLDPAEDPEGEPCIVRDCQGCDGEFALNLYYATEIPPDSQFSLCPGCRKDLLARGRMMLLKLCGPPRTKKNRLID